MNDDEMHAVHAIDLYALPSREEGAEANCPVCDRAFWVVGGYIPYYSSYGSEEEAALFGD